MNNPPAGYYQAISSYPTTEMEAKCQFCDSILLPTHSDHHGMPSMAGIQWFCINCPCQVAYGTNMDDYTLMVLHNKYWYNIAYLPHSKQYVIYKLTTYLAVHPERANESIYSTRELIKTIESEKNITPQNAKDKLLTILTFS